MRMNEIKITMERCREVSQTTSSPPLLLPLTVQGPEGKQGSWTLCTVDQGFTPGLFNSGTYSLISAVRATEHIFSDSLIL